MKKRLILLTLAITTGIFASAQTHIGLKGQFGNTWIFNQNIADAGDFLDYRASFEGGFGLHVIQQFGGTSGIGLSLGVSKIEQQLSDASDDDIDVFSRTHMRYTDVGLFYTKVNDGGFYFEVGPQFSFRSEDIDQYLFIDGDQEAFDTYQDPRLNTLAIYGVIGLGGFIPVSDDFKIGLGVRFGYQLNDLTEELSLSEYLVESEKEDFGYFTELAHNYEQEVILPSLEDPLPEQPDPTLNYKGTHNAFGSIQLGFYYTIGN